MSRNSILGAIPGDAGVSLLDVVNFMDYAETGVGDITQDVPQKPKVAIPPVAELNYASKDAALSQRHQQKSAHGAMQKQQPDQKQQQVTSSQPVLHKPSKSPLRSAFNNAPVPPPLTMEPAALAAYPLRKSSLSAQSPSVIAFQQSPVHSNPQNSTSASSNGASKPSSLVGSTSASSVSIAAYSGTYPHTNNIGQPTYPTPPLSASGSSGVAISATDLTLSTNGYANNRRSSQNSTKSQQSDRFPTATNSGYPNPSNNYTPGGTNSRSTTPTPPVPKKYEIPIPPTPPSNPLPLLYTSQRKSFDGQQGSQQQRKSTDFYAPQYMNGNRKSLDSQKTKSFDLPPPLPPLSSVSPRLRSQSFGHSNDVSSTPSPRSATPTWQSPYVSADVPPALTAKSPSYSFASITTSGSRPLSDHFRDLFNSSSSSTTPLPRPPSEHISGWNVFSPPPSPRAPSRNGEPSEQSSSGGASSMLGKVFGRSRKKSVSNLFPLPVNAGVGPEPPLPSGATSPLVQARRDRFEEMLMNREAETLKMTLTPTFLENGRVERGGMANGGGVARMRTEQDGLGEDGADDFGGGGMRGVRKPPSNKSLKSFSGWKG
ncbi:hypothetical protein BJ742DRAFT_778115 [Cladochytrium replicatum]|nr:hypothetical protein BJ742DRAFT_778115 [Cladochytrium replicatum]